MKKIILTFSLLTFFAFLANFSFASNTQTTFSANSEIISASVELPEFNTEEIEEEVQNNKGTIITIASLAIFLILFILLWLSARDSSSKRKLEAKDATTKLTDLTKKYETLKEEVLRLRTENTDLNVLLEKEKTKTENLNDQIQRFETTTTTLNTKLEELQKTVKPSISDAARQELDNLEIKSAKLQNIAKLKEQNAITEAEANEMKAKLIQELS